MVWPLRAIIAPLLIVTPEALAFAAEGKVKATVETHPLDSINEIFECLKTGRVNGRIVLATADHASTQDRFR